MIPEEARQNLHKESEFWTLKLAVAEIFQRLHMAEDWHDFEKYFSRNYEYHKDRLLTELEDTDPALAALIDDREVSQLSELP